MCIRDRGSTRYRSSCITEISCIILQSSEDGDRDMNTVADETSSSRNESTVQQEERVSESRDIFQPPLKRKRSLSHNKNPVDRHQATSLSLIHI